MAKKQPPKKPSSNASASGLDFSALDAGGLDFDLDFDLNMDSAPEADPDPMQGYAYTGDAAKDSAEEMSAVKRAFIARAKAENDRRRLATDSEYWFCVCFQSREQVEEFLRYTKWAAADAKYIDGQKLAKKLGVAVTPVPAVKSGAPRLDAKLMDLSLDLD